MSKEKTAELLQKLEQGVNEVFSSQRYKDYLNFVAKFHNYSYFNTLLILSQNENATYVAGFKKWNELGRQIQKGEKGIAILAPSFKTVQSPLKDSYGNKVLDQNGEPVLDEGRKMLSYFIPVHVFDVSQTKGEPLPEIAKPIDLEVDGFDSIFDALSQISPYPVLLSKLSPGLNGFVNHRKNAICISEDLSEAHTIKTLIHEIAHARLHVVRDGKGGSSLVKRDVTDLEIEAESVAYIVCQHLGFDTSEYSFDYIADWSKNKNSSQLKNALNIISKEANAIITSIEAVLTRTQEHEKVRASGVR